VRVVFFQNISDPGAHLGAVHVTAICKMPDGSRSHISFLGNWNGRRAV